MRTLLIREGGTSYIVSCNLAGVTAAAATASKDKYILHTLDPYSSHCAINVAGPAKYTYAGTLKCSMLILESQFKDAQSLSPTEPNCSLINSCQLS